MSATRLFTSESVADGHPDKVCDQISDAVLDACLEQDPMSRVAIECAVKSDTVYVFGELTTHAEINVEKIVRDTLKRIGYNDPQWQFDPWKIKIFQNITEQSPEIGTAVTGQEEKIGAGDQGIMFGYAVGETPELMPLPIQIAHDLMKWHRMIRTDDAVVPRYPFGPDGKSQITVRYADTGEPIEIDTVVFSTVHRGSIDQLRNWCDYWVPQAIKMSPHYGYLFSHRTKVLINPAGQWHVGGPVADSGLTGRKIIVDTYGGAARHGGGAFSGKDPTKVDRSAAYAARHLAKAICAHTGRHRTEVQLSYAIGVPEPVSIHVYGMTESEIKSIIRELDVDLTPSGIIRQLDLRRPIYQETAAFGHFGRLEFPWEHV